MAFKLAVMGSTGRLGKHIVALAQQDPNFSITNSEEADVIIDVSSPLACENNLSLLKPLVIGTTGHSPDNHKLIEQAASSLPILFAPNFSFGMTVCLEAVAFLAKQLRNFCTIDITETHHQHKKDKPSGTALALSQALNLESPPPIHSIREGEILGEHTVTFFCEGEKITLNHTVQSRNAFAKGALKAAQFLIHQNPGLYSMKDVLYAAR
jgi:4-hydroxy-tetrahydrodipicolinate reductase